LSAASSHIPWRTPAGTVGAHLAVANGAAPLKQLHPRKPTLLPSRLHASVEQAIDNYLIEGPPAGQLPGGNAAQHVVHMQTSVVGEVGSAETEP
jgi:hypothetical protein